MSVDYVGELVHNKKNRETGQFSTEKTEMAIPHQAFTCVTLTPTHTHTQTQRPLPLFVSISLSDVNLVIQLKLRGRSWVAKFVFYQV